MSRQLCVIHEYYVDIIIYWSSSIYAWFFVLNVTWREMPISF